MNTPLDQVIRDVLDPLIPAGRPLALFDFPNHSNVGDSAIWLGEQNYLHKRGLSSAIIWMTDAAAAKVRALPELPEDCIVLIHGGGNFGDLWPDHQRLRERLLQHYRTHRIIQLPQSIHFGDADKANQSRAIFSGHPDFHLVVRDHESLAIARALYDCHTHLCPDMALHLVRWPRPAPATHDLFALLRTDREQRAEADTGSASRHDIVFDDWIEETPKLAIHADRALLTLETRYPNRFTTPQALRQRIYKRLALQRMDRGCRQLASGRVVISDRLHAHILCTLMGIPHVVLDNSYRKIGNFRDAWHTGEELCRSATRLDEAIALAQSMLQCSANFSTNSFVSKPLLLQSPDHLP